MSIKVGDVVEISAVTKRNNVLDDPTTLALLVTNPMGVVTTYNWPSGVEIIRDAMGTFHADILANLPGLWSFVWAAAGDVDAVGNSTFNVDPVPEQVRWRVVDQSALPMVGVNVMVTDGAKIVAGGKTDATGYTSYFKMQPGTKQVELGLAKSQFANPYATIVTNTGGAVQQTYTLVGTALSIATASSLTKVKLFGYLKGADGRGSTEAQVVVETVGLGNVRPFVNQDQAVWAEVRETYPDSSGYWEMDVIADSTIRVTVPEMRFAKTFRVPVNVSTLNIAEARSDAGPGQLVGISTDNPVRGNG